MARLTLVIAIVLLVAALSQQFIQEKKELTSKRHACYIQVFFTLRNGHQVTKNYSHWSDTRKQCQGYAQLYEHNYIPARELDRKVEWTWQEI